MPSNLEGYSFKIRISEVACNLATSNTWVWKLSMNSTPCGVRGTRVRNLRLPRADVLPKSMKSGGKVWCNSEKLLNMPGSMMARLWLTCFYEDRISSILSIFNYYGVYITNSITRVFLSARSPKHSVGYQGARSVQSSRGGCARPHCMQNEINWRRLSRSTFATSGCSGRPKAGWMHFLNSQLVGKDPVKMLPSWNWTLMGLTSRRPDTHGSTPWTPSHWRVHGGPRFMYLVVFAGVCPG